MNAGVRLITAMGVLAAALMLLPAPAGTAAGICEDGVQESGALYRICLPDSNWNGDLILYAHGYVDPQSPLAIPDDHLPDGTSISEVINALGYAYATSSYSKNGLAVRQGVEDMADLAGIFVETHGEPGRVLIGGASEGGIVTTLSVERRPDAYDGGLAACGPIGSFQKQINYIGDFRAVFDYFFPGVIPGSPIDVPQEVIDNWDAVYVPAIEAAIAARPHATEQLLTVTGAPIDPANPATIAETVVGVLWYATHATNDASETLGGQPFDNSHRWYAGSDYDLLLNLRVQRIAAEPAALDEVAAHYGSSGVLSAPLVTLHTTGDQIVPYWHEPRYRLKTLVNNPLQHSNIRIERYGHCNFTFGEVLQGLVRLLVMLGPGE